MAKGLDIGGILTLFISAFVLFTIVDALYDTVNTAVSNMNVTMTTAGFGYM